LLTVAALLPRTWHLRLVDLDIEPLDERDLLWADYVLIGAMIVHRESVHEIVRRCRLAERTVIAGGPLFTTGHEGFPDIEHFVLGEAEDVAPELARDMETGTLRQFYRADDFPSLDQSPVPRWDLLDLRRYATMSVQFSRGCPHDCEFCDIAVLNGRTPRTKPPERLVAELDALRRLRWRGPVFIVDDNFIGHRRNAKELLRAIIRWRRATRPDMEFITEATVDLARSPELLELMVDAGFKKVFLGLETPDPASLRECHKTQNLREDLLESVRRIQAAGLEVMGGFIIGFDNDKPDIFQRQFQFIQKAGVVTAMVGLLTALPRTKLYQRLVREGRLLDESGGNNTSAVCNFIPRIDRETLTHGYRQLMHALYEPVAYYDRARAFLAHYKPRGPQRRLTLEDLRALCRATWTLGVRQRGRRAYWRFLAHTLAYHPRAFSVAVTLAVYGHHFRRVAQEL
jgi:radical SAM superfamily enzyme YgiQ (UPF0313 family)